MVFKDLVSIRFKELQKEICQKIAICDGFGQFVFEEWNREEGGGGISSQIQDGYLIEKGGVNFSAVEGKLPPAIEKNFGVENVNFFATGVSIVIHPKNPWIPIIHMNIRYFEMDGGRSWFGGGIDLTPHYIVLQDAKFFHEQLKLACDEFDLDYYPQFKNWADNYFYIPHRKETRGVGGIFFDKLEATSEKSIQDLLNFVLKIGNSFIPIYTAILNKYREKPYTQQEKNWQFQRRGRYVEFNLVYDAGTKFGLETNGRTESILMSLPPMATWVGPFIAEKDSLEEFTLNHLKKGHDWLIAE
jgi:coproporphyrinogen III oxidase